MTEWQPIETAPKDGRTILAWWEKSQNLVVIYWESDGWDEPGQSWYEANGDGAIFGPTHWIEIPQPPGWIVGRCGKDYGF